MVGVKLEDGRDVTQGNKYRQATEKKVKILNETQFEQLVRDLSGNQTYTLGVRKAGILDNIVATPLQVVNTD